MDSDFARRSGFQSKDKDVQMAILRSCLSDGTLKIVMNLPDSDKTDPTKVIAALKMHAVGQLNVVMEGRNFNLHAQQDSESFDDFYTDLKDLSKTCEFCEKCEDSLIRDCMVVGLIDGDTVERLLVKRNISLQKTIELCRAEETAKKH